MASIVWWKAGSADRRMPRTPQPLSNGSVAVDGALYWLAQVFRLPSQTAGKNRHVYATSLRDVN